ncbi:MAG: N-acetylmuramoyl-L-alanine amidase [Erysipelothrix sp.]|nr:N-acetylmuramoyl-L-alanine amidase [Erysipelothrix sp.]
MPFKQRKPEVNRYANRMQKRIIIIICVLIVLVSATFILYKKNNPEPPIVGNTVVCDFEQEQIINTFADYRFTDNIFIQDYMFYGETLNLFQEEYVINTPDKLVGKTILLRNVCTNEEFTYLVDRNVDGQIALQNLPFGFYEVFMNIDLVKRRVIFTEPLYDELHLVRRLNQDRVVKLMADRSIFDDQNHHNFLSGNYLFIQVEPAKNEEVYDIVLDPNYGINENGYFDNYGRTFLGMVQADELYSQAELIKKELESYGYKVLITRDSQSHIINTYGIDGRLDRAYASGAKYYIELGFNESPVGGLRLYHSAFASNHFSFHLIDRMLNNTDLQAYNETGIVYPNKYRGLDGVITVREAGGKATAAATFSELSRDANSSFALNNRQGMEAVKIEYFSIFDENATTAYKEQKGKYASVLAEAIHSYFKLGELDDIPN